MSDIKKLNNKNCHLVWQTSTGIVKVYYCQADEKHTTTYDKDKDWDGEKFNSEEEMLSFIETNNLILPEDEPEDEPEI